MLISRLALTTFISISSISDCPFFTEPDRRTGGVWFSLWNLNFPLWHGIGVFNVLNCQVTSMKPNFNIEKDFSRSSATFSGLDLCEQCTKLLVWPLHQRWFSINLLLLFALLAFVNELYMRYISVSRAFLFASLMYKWMVRILNHRQSRTNI